VISRAIELSCGLHSLATFGLLNGITGNRDLQIIVSKWAIHLSIVQIG
jgi:hypothetical protein